LKGSAAQHGNLAGAVIVATPQEVALIDVRKEVNFCRKTGIPILGVVENMAGLRAPLRALRVLAADGRDVTAAVMQAAEAAGGGGPLFAETEVFVASGGGAAAMAKAMDVPFLGRVPLDAAVSAAGEAGRSVFDGAPGGGPAAAAPALRAVLDALVAAAEAPRGAPGAGGAAAQ
jgi:Mrp family chromosome partitioning ATPase